MTATNHLIPELDRKGLREFAILTGAIVAGLFGVFFPWVFDTALTSWPVWPWIIFASLATWGLVAPMSLRPVYRLWMRFGLLLSRITTPLIMGAVFFLVITPVALIWKVMGKDAMARELDDSSTYRKSSRKTSVENLKRPF